MREPAGAPPASVLLGSPGCRGAIAANTEPPAVPLPARRVGRQRGVSESLTYSSPVTAVLVAVRFVQILLPHGLIR